MGKEDLVTRLENKSPTRQMRHIFSHDKMKDKIKDKNSSMNSYLQMVEGKKGRRLQDNFRNGPSESDLYLEEGF